MTTAAKKSPVPKTPTVTNVAKLEPVTKRISNLEEGSVRTTARLSRHEKVSAEKARELEDRIVQIERMLNG